MDSYVSMGQEALHAGDWSNAKTNFEAALQTGDNPEAFDGLGIALWWLNQIDLAHEQRVAAFVGYKRQGNMRRAGVVAAWLAREQVFLDGNQSAMKGWFARAERLLNAADPCPEQGWLALFRASMMATPAELAQIADQTLTLARQSADYDLEALALAFAGLAHVTLGNVARGMALIDEAMVSATSGELDNYMTVSEIFCVTLSSCELAGDFVRTEHWCQAASDYAQRHNCPFLSAYCRTTYGSLLTATGRWKAADTALTEAIHAFESGHRALRVHAVLKLADLRVCQGRLEEAEIMLTGYEDFDEALIPRARLQLAYGNMESARSILEQSLQSNAAPTLHQAPILHLLVEVQLVVGDLDSARQSVQRLADLVQQTDSDFLLAQVDLTNGRLKRISGDSDAAQALQSALDRLHRYEQSLLAGRIRLEMASLLKETDTAGAISWAKAAQATFTRLGATRDADAASKILRDLGIARPTLRTHKDLTQREAQILALVAHGLTNREIGERLFLSAKTVEHHVSQILSKLGVRSRVEAAALATSLNLGSS